LLTQAADLIRENDEVVYGVSGYLGIQKRSEVVSDAHLSSIDYRINCRPGRLPKVSDNAIDWERYIKNRKYLCAAKWSTHSESLSASLAARKRRTAV
jgi:IS5 family transposase